MIAALFDSDGTLYTNQMGRGMIQYALAHDRRLVARKYYASVAIGYALRKLRLMKPQRFQHSLITGMAALIEGTTEQEAATVFDWVTRGYLLPSRRADAAERLRATRTRVTL